MKKIIFLLAFLLASFSFLSAQNLVLQNQDLEIKAEKQIEKPQTRADYELSYSSGTVQSHGGYSNAVGVSYTSACISYTAGQMANYVGSSLTAIETYIGPLTAGTNNFMAGWTAYKIWIKTSLSGAVVYEQDVTSQVTLETWNTFTLNTPYTITGGLVMGYTVTFNLTTAGARYAMPFENTFAPYCSGSFNALYSTNANAYGAGATWSPNEGRAAAIFGHVTATLQANDLCAVSLTSAPIKLVNNPTTFGVWVFNAGSASQNNFTVQLLDLSDNVLGTTTVTTALAAGAHKLYNVAYTPTAVGPISVKGKVILTGDQIPSNNDAPQQLKQYVYPITPMGYCTFAIENGIGPATPPADGSAAISYTAANMAPFVGKYLTGIHLGISPGGTISNGTVWIRNARDGANIYSQPFTPVDGWNFITLNTPYLLTAANTFIGYTITIGSGNVLGATNNTQVANVNHIAIGTNWYNMNQVTTTGNMCVLGSIVNELPANVTITPAVNPAGAGTVSPSTPQTVPSGTSVTLTATANAGYTFQNWTNGATVLSSTNPYTFNATETATITANFTGGQGSCNAPTNLNVAYNGTTCTTATLTWTAPTKGGNAPEQGKIFKYEGQARKMNKRPADQYQPDNTPDNTENPLRGSMGYGFLVYPASEFGLWKWDVTAATTTRTKVGNYTDEWGGGAYYNGFIYAYQNEYDEDYYYTDVTFHKINPTTGLSVSAIPVPDLYGFGIESMSYDFSTNTMYALSANTLFTVNLATGNVTEVAECTGFVTPATSMLITLAIDLTGNMYTIQTTGSGSSRLYKINKTNGVCTLVGTNTGATGIQYAQSMAFDHNVTPEVLYWCLSTSSNDRIRTVNTTSGSSTQIVSSWYETVGFTIPYDVSGPEPVTYNVYRGTTKLNTTPVTGTTFTDNTFTATEGYTWHVKAICPTTGESNPASKTMDPCDQGTPACNPPTALNVEYNGTCTTANLSWTAPTTKGEKGEAPNYIITGERKLSKIAELLQNKASRKGTITQEFYKTVSGERGPTSTAYGVDTYAGGSGNTKAVSAPLNNPAGMVTFGGVHPTQYTGGCMVNGQCYAITDELNNIYKIDLTTGTYTVTATHTASGAYGNMCMAYNPVDSKVYITAIDDDGTNYINKFYTINVNTGATQFVKDVISSPLGYNGVFMGMTFSNTGECIAAHNEGFLVKVNLTTGASTLLIDTYEDYDVYPYFYYEDITTDAEDGMIYWAVTNDMSWECELWKVNLANNSMSYLGDFPSGSQIVPFVIPAGTTPPPTATYNVYCDGAKVNSAPITTTNYTATTVNLTTAHTWAVKAICEAGGESNPATKAMNACVPAACEAAKNLKIEQWEDCRNILTWEKPTGKGSNVTFTPAPIMPPFTPTAEELAKREQMEAAQNAATVSPFAEENPRMGKYDGTTLESGSKGVILWDNTNISIPTSGSNGLISSYWAGANSWVYTADDFTADAPWTIEKIHVRGFASQGPPASPQPTKMSIVIYQDNGNKPGTEVYRNNTVPVTSWTTDAEYFDNAVVTLPTPYILPAAGKYWIATAGAYDGPVATTGSRWNVASGTTGIGTNFHLHDPGNLFGYGTSWMDALALVSPLKSMWFKLEGQLGGTLCPAVSNVTATQATGSQNVNVTWTASTGSPSSYQVLRNGNTVGTATPPATTYTENNVPVGTHTYTVKAVYPASNDCIPQGVDAPAITVNEVLPGGCEGKIVGTGTTAGYYYPINTLYEYSYTQQIYDAAQIGKVGEITSIAFNYVHATAISNCPIVVYIGHTTKSTFAGTSDFIPLSQMTKVYEGPANFNNSKPWSQIDIAPFMYEGGNLVVAIQNNRGSWFSGNTFNYFTGTGNKSLRYYRDYTPINLNNPMEGAPTNGASADRANIKFVICPPIEYNVYRNGNLLTTVNKPTYTDLTADYTIPNEYCIKVKCEAGGESNAICKIAPICKPEPCGTVQNLAATYGLDCAFAKLTWNAPILPKSSKGGSNEPEYNGPFGVETPEAEKLAIVNAPVDNTIYLRRAPEGTQQSSTPLPDFFPSRGSSDPVYYGDSGGAVRKGTVGTPFPPVTVGSNGAFQQAYEYINGEIYAARWSSGNQLGKINMSNGAWQNIGSIAQCDAASLCYNPVDGLTYVFPFTGTDTEGTNWGTINLNTGQLTVKGNMTGQPTPYVAINNAGVAYATRMGTTDFGTINLTTGAFTPLATAPITPAYIQNMSFDRETGLLYWLACDGTNALYYEINVAATPVTFTLKGTHTTNWMAFTTITEAGTPCAGVTGVTAAVIAGTKNVKVNWNALSGAQSYEVTRDGVSIYTGTQTTCTDEAATPGNRIYCVKAIFPASADCIPVSVCAPAVAVPELFDAGCEGKIVGNGTTAQYYYPINTYYNYSYTQQIYDAAELGIEAGQKIKAVSFNWIFNQDKPFPIEIYIGCTTQATFAAASNFIPLAQMKKVFDGTFTFEAGKPWNTIFFPAGSEFEYTGNNIVVAVVNKKGSYTDIGSANTFNVHTTTGNKGVRYYQDSGLINLNAPAGSSNAVVGTTRNNIRFIACEDQKAYNIYRDGVLIAENYIGKEYVDDIANGMKPDEPHCWEVKYVREGDHNLECPDGAQICLTNCAEETCNDVTAIVGTGTTGGYHPFAGFYGFQRSIMLYEANEIKGSGSITELAFNVSSANSSARPVKIYLLPTTATTLDAQYVWNTLKAAATLVYDASTAFPATGWRTFAITPFNYDGVQNLLVLIESSGCTLIGGCSVQNTYTVKTNCFWFNRTDNNPPNDGILGGTRDNNRPNIRIQITCPPKTVDMMATKIVICPSKVKTQTPYDVDVTVKNNGLNPATNYKVQIIDYPSMAVIKEVTIPGPLAPNATITHTISDVTFTTSGEKILRGRVEIAGDVNPLNNQTANINITVRPKDDNQIVEIPCPVNQGADQNTVPFHFYYNQSYAQSLYTEAEMGIAGGYIKDITWFYNNTATAAQNRPVKVYFATTDKNTLSGGWIPFEEFTLVYDGNIAVPLGVSEVTLSLKTPYYLYMGGNLVIMTERVHVGTTYISGVNAKTTVVSPAVRSREHHADAQFTIPPTAAGNELNYIPNIRLTVYAPPAGVVEGTVTLATYGTPIENVDVKLPNLGITKKTDSNGKYKFQYVPTGAHTIQATKLGYFDVNVPSFNVAQNVTYVKDIQMELLPLNIVFGVVRAAEGMFIKDAEITLTGYHTYETTSLDYGVFEFLDVYAPKEYTLTIKAKGYQTHTQTVMVNGTVNLGTIILYDITKPPLNVVAKINEPYVDVTWNKAGGGGGNIIEDCESYPAFTIHPTGDIAWTYWDNGDNTYGFTNYDFPGAYSAFAYMAFKPSATSPSMSGEPEIQPHGGQQFFAALANTTTVNNNWIISPELPANELQISFWAKTFIPDYGLERFKVRYSTTTNATSAFTNYLAGSASAYITVPTTWTKYQYTIPADAKYVAIQCVSDDSFVFMLDDISITSGKKSGNDDDRREIAVAKSAASSVEFTRAKGINTIPPVIVNTENTRGDDRGIVGYKVWRFAKADKDNPAAWVSLTNNPVNAYTYKDMGWPGLDVGSYMYAVKTCYHGGIESAPGFSNVVNKLTKVSFTVNIKTNSGDTPAGAIVKMTLNQDTTVISTATSTATGVIFDQIAAGESTLEIKKAGYEDFKVTNVNVIQGGVYEALLKEIIVEPYGPKIEEITTCQHKFSWNNILGLADFEDSFESGNFDKWAKWIQGPGTPGDSGPNPYWHVVTSSTPYDGPKSAYLDWGYNINTWIISPNIAITPATKLSFAFMGSYYWSVSPNANSDCFVKVSTDDGNTWTSIWREEDYGTFSNFVWCPVNNLSLAAYAGKAAKIAFNFVGDDCATWNIDAVKIKNAKGDDSKGFKGYTVYLDGVQVAEGVQGTEYMFLNTPKGSHIAGVKAVYSSGASAMLTIPFTSNCDYVPPKYTVTFEITDCETQAAITDATIMFNEIPLSGYVAANLLPGKYPYTITRDDCGVKSGEVEVVDKNLTEIVCLDCVGVKDYDYDYKIYPNPASHSLTVERPASTPATIEIYNAMGMFVGRYETEEVKFEISVATLSAGTYFIRVTEGATSSVKSFVKK